MAYSDHEQALRVASAISAVATGCCLRYGLFASILRQPVTDIDEPTDAFHHYYDLLRTIGLSTTEDMIHPTRTWLVCRIAVPEPVERYFLQGFHRWHIEWVEVVSPEDIVLPSDPVLMSLQTIVGLTEEVHDHAETSGRVRLVARPGAVSLDRVAQQYARATTGIGDRSVVGGAAAVGRGDADGERGAVASSVASAIIKNARSRASESRLSVVADHFC